MGYQTFQLACVCLVLTFYHGTCDSETLREVGDRFFAWRMRERPLQATKRNIYTYNDQLEQFSLDKLDDDKKMADTLLSDLENITMTELDEREIIIYQILKDMLHTFIEGYQYKDYVLNPINFLDGIHRDPLSFLDVIPFNTIGDYENYILRLRHLPEQLRQFERLMLEAVRRNTTLHLVSVRRVERQIKPLLVGDITKSVFFSPFEKLGETNIPSRMWSDIRRDGFDAVRELIQAYRQLQTWMKSTYMPRTRRSIAAHKDYYLGCLKWYTSLSMTPEEIHDLGEKEVERIKENMNQILERQNYTGTIAEYFEFLREDPRFFKSDPADILDEFRTIITDRIDPELPKMFKELPKYNLRVVPMAADGPAGRYRLPSPDGHIPGTFVVNIMRPKEMPLYTFMSLAMHEASPGHHLQISMAMSEDTPMFMRYKESPLTFQVPYAFPSYTAFIEGWALYAESLGEEFGLYRDDYELMGRYSSEIFRAGRLVVDTGIHYFGWDREKAIEYLQNITAKTRPFIEVEVDRYITWPGQAVSYKIGELTIKDLRKLAEENLGDDFDIREFHAVVLANGYKPLNLLSEAVKSWSATYNTPKECDTSRASDMTSVTSCVVLSLVTLVYAHLFQL